MLKEEDYTTIGNHQKTRYIKIKLARMHFPKHLPTQIKSRAHQSHQQHDSYFTTDTFEKYLYSALRQQH